MLSLDPFTLLLSFTVFIIYAAVCGIAILFTFFLDIYMEIDAKLKLDVLTARVMTPLEANIQWMDAWFIKYNKIIGPILIVLSMIDLKLFFDIINKL